MTESATPETNAQSSEPSAQANQSESVLERKLRTRKLINMGGLIIKAELDILPSNTLYGALLTLRNQLVGKNKEDMYHILDEWTTLGKAKFEQELKQGDAVALKFNAAPSKEVLDKLKNFGLKWNGLRKEWEGVVRNIDNLKSELGSADYRMQSL